MQKKGIKQRVKILKILSQSDFVSGQSIADSCNISRIAVWKHINYLKNNGVKIETRSNKGYSFIDFGNRLLPEVVQLRLPKNSFVKEVIYFDETDSTNNAAKRILKEGSLIIAEQQKRGRGRNGKEWKSQKYKDILFSLTISPKLPYYYLPIFNIIGVLSVARALNRLFKIGAKVKWPNDVLIGNKKVAGVLIEFVAEIDLIDKLILGIGVDINSKSKLSNLSSISSILKKDKLDRLSILISIISELNSLIELIENKDFSKIKSIWKSHSLDYGKSISIIQDNKKISGKSKGIDRYGHLIVKSGSISNVIYSSGSRNFL
ncbi:MAG: biotin--[acetyl-CoA-carboxylase] ligase [Candidatus Kaelpia aquatica]|nr:biotin--[acetyl-CoA-carboxylase] ligase [Candidatus Kaelpia aquatica]